MLVNNAMSGFTARLYASAVLGVGNSVCPFVCPVRQTVLCNETEERTVDIFTPQGRAITLVL